MSEESIQNNEPEQEFDAEQNLLGVFAILLAVDKRINPENYQHLKPEQHD